ncbi:flagellar brake protein [Azotobacter vinelandii]
MEQASDTYSRIEHPDKCRDLLEQLCEQGGARLIGLSPDTPSLAVVLMEVVPGERLVIDLTALPAVAPLLESGGYDSRLAGRVASTLLRSAPLGGWQRLSVPGRVQLACPWPEWLEILHRRSAFRAELPTRLTVPVEVLPAGGMRPFAGRLLDLSQGGCRIELPAGSASELQAGQVVEQVVLRFPNGQQIGLRGKSAIASSTPTGRRPVSASPSTGPPPIWSAGCGSTCARSNGKAPVARSAVTPRWRLRRCSRPAGWRRPATRRIAMAATTPRPWLVAWRGSRSI